MRIRLMVKGHVRRPPPPLVGWMLATVLAALAGCSTTETNPKTPTPRADFLEYRDIVVQSMSLMDATLRSLDEISVAAYRDPRPAYEAFARSVHRLEVESIKVRARTQAMRARGDAYFEHWEKYLSTVKDGQVRELAAEHRPELKQCFEQVQQGAQQVREGFRPFLSDLQKLRAVLHADPSLAHIAAQKALILSAEEKGRQVQAGMARILAEMNSMTALLRPPAAAPAHSSL
jgi:hypothetical protein